MTFLLLRIRSASVCMKNAPISGISLRAGINGVALEDRYSMQGDMNSVLRWSVGGGAAVTAGLLHLTLDYAISNTPDSDIFITLVSPQITTFLV